MQLRIHVSTPFETTEHHSSELGTYAWQQLSSRVDELTAAWQGDDLPPDLARYLPEQPPALRQMTLVELIKVDLEFRWLHYSLPKKLEEYLGEFPELAVGGEIPCDLIYEEFHIRSRTEDCPRTDEYLERFPRQADQLRRLFDVQTNKTSSTVISTRRLPEVEVGQQLDDFDLLTRLGKGAFASVYLARQRSMQRLVALKVSADRGDEPQTLAQLDHPHIVRVFDQRFVPDRRLRLLYMQLVPGGTLQAVVDRVRETPVAKRTGRLLSEAVDGALAARGESPTEESSLRRRLAGAKWPEVVCWLGARLAAALDYAHGRGVLHRDVKPANVLLTAEGVPKLADFNVSFSSKLDGATPAAYFGGSLAYMSPEQLEASNPAHPRAANELDGRSDVFSLGVMLWELLTGVRPFGTEQFEGSWTETLARLTERRRAGLPAEALAALPHDLPQGMTEALLSAMAANAEDRPRTAGELARQLELCLQPRAQRLFRPGNVSIAHWARRWPLWAIIACAVLPNAVFSGLNIVFNLEIVVEKLAAAVPSIRDVFKSVMLWVVNGAAYSVGTALGLYWSWPVIRFIREGRSSNSTFARHDADSIRRRIMWLGDYLSWVTFVLWFLSGFVFAGWLHHEMARHGEPVSLDLYGHFIPTQFLYGLIAGTQVFFALTTLAVRSFDPLLIVPASSEDHATNLRTLRQRSGWYFAIAISTPFVALLLLGTTQNEEYRNSIVITAATGFVCSLFAWYLFRLIQDDIDALVAASEPQARAFASGGDGTESFWTASR